MAKADKKQASDGKDGKETGKSWLSAREGRKSVARRICSLVVFSQCDTQHGYMEEKNIESKTFSK